VENILNTCYVLTRLKEGNECFDIRFFNTLPATNGLKWNNMLANQVKTATSQHKKENEDENE